MESFKPSPFGLVRVTSTGGLICFSCAPPVLPVLRLFGTGVGAVNAASCADMALAGVGSRIPVDEVIDCMGEVGRRMPMEMRETALGGLAATPTGKAVKERMEQQD